MQNLRDRAGSNPGISTHYPRDGDFAPRSSWFSRESIGSVSDPEEWTIAQIMGFIIDVIKD
eukprot:5010281-Prorocentrum_lima.AAC.1